MKEEILLTIEEFNEAEKYWLAKLSGELDVINWIPDCPRPKPYRSASSTIPFARDVTGALIRMSKDNNLSLYILLLTALKVLLYKYTGQSDIAVASPVYTSTNREYNRFVILRDVVDASATFKELLMAVRQTVIDGYRNEHYPVDKIMKTMKIEGQPLFRCALSLENIHGTGWVDDLAANFENEITLSIRKDYRRIEGDVIYHSGLFERDTMQRFCGHFLRVLARALDDTGILIKDIDLNTAEERDQLLFAFNHTKRDVPPAKTIHRLFEDQVEKNPDNVATVLISDLTDIYEEMASEVVNPRLFDRLKRCCFKRAPYIFQRVLDVPQAQNRLKLLKSSGHDSLMVNPNAARLLDLFDGKRDVGCLFSGLKDRGIAFTIWPVGKGDVLEIAPRYGEKIEISLTDDFGDFVRIIKMLYNRSLIELVGVNFAEDGSGHDLPGYFEEPPTAISDISVIDCLKQEKNLTKGPVLLIGDTPGTPSVGLLYLAGYLRRNGIQARCQFTDMSRDYASLRANTVELLEKIEPEIVGVSMKWFPYMARVLDICKIVKAHSPGIKVVVGGNTASYYWREMIRYDCIDYVVRGDGELPLLRICQGAAHIPNCVYKRDGEVIQNPITYVQDETNSGEIYLSHLDEILISPYNSLFGSFFLYTHKGCPMSCIYCGGCRTAQERVFKRTRFFKRAPQQVRNDLMLASQYASTLLFDFTLVNDRLIDYCRQIWEGIDLSSHFCVYTNVYTPSPELIEYVNRTFKYVYLDYDLASLSQRHRRHLYSLGLVKPQPADSEMLDFFAECQKYQNIEVRVNIVNGLPFFNQEDIDSSEKMLSHILTAYSCFGDLHWARLHAQPAAPIVDNPGQYDMYSYAADFSDFLKQSEANFNRESSYPTFDQIKYPYIYFNDETFNARVSRHYTDMNAKVVQNRENKSRGGIVSESLSYRELNQRANQVARLLKGKGVRPGHLVGILMESSLAMAAAILGVLKAGGAYLPLDADYPQRRIEQLLEGSGVEVLLSQEKLVEKRAWRYFPVENIVTVTDTTLAAVCPSKRVPESKPDDLAYVIYTSGTTGKPKGIPAEHRNVVNYALWRINAYGFTHRDVTLQLLSYCFDGFGSNFYASLLSGGSIIMVPEAKRLDFDFIKRAIRHFGVTNTSMVPGIYEALLQQAGKEDLKSLRFVVLAGEESRPELIRTSKEIVPALLINEYGPSETTVAAAAHPDMDEAQVAIIGQPIANAYVYILDKCRRPCPLKVAGELCVSGAGVTRGYLNDPELTVRKFRENPFVQGERLYFTGDLARWLPGGTVELLGRIDHQLKIDGYRIEPAEIENLLLAHGEIEDAVVMVAGTPEGRRLCAFVVTGRPTAASALRDYLAETLPYYMIPARFIPLDKIPLTTNGKVDRRSLLRWEPAIGEEKDNTDPRNPVERRVLTVWKRVLNTEKIGVFDNFFTLGGNSYKAVQIVSELIQDFDITINAIFHHQTVADLSANVSRKRGHLKSRIEEILKMVRAGKEGREKRPIELSLRPEYREYGERLREVRHMDLKPERSYRHILLTGATGFLGAHLIPELLKATGAKLYLLVRGETDSGAADRLDRELSFYFGSRFFQINRERLTVVRGDLREKHLGMSQGRNKTLCETVEAVVHCAANVRHFGNYEDSFEDNVMGTRRLLEFSAAGRVQDFHFVSTLSVGSGDIEGKKFMLFTEFSHDVGQQHDNVYIRSKLAAEKEVLAFRQKGLHTSIYRPGNLIFHSETGKFQQNIEASAFYANFKAFLLLGIAPEVFGLDDMTFVDWAARALVLLMTRKGLYNETFHIHNNRRLSWQEMEGFLRKVDKNVRVVDLEQFLQCLLSRINDNHCGPEIDRLLLHSGLFDTFRQRRTMSMVVSDRTRMMLKRLGFEWPRVTAPHIVRMVDHCRSVGFLP
jgi:amino acid adenylation domain-containing protein/thioester reductase-like protein